MCTKLIAGELRVFSSDTLQLPQLLRCCQGLPYAGVKLHWCITRSAFLNAVQTQINFHRSPADREAELKSLGETEM